MRVVKYLLFLFFLTVPLRSIYAQDFDLYLIDSYVTPEKPYTFIISFFTSEEVKTKVLINETYDITVSDEYLLDHIAEIDFTDYIFTNKFVPFTIISETRDGNVIQSEVFEVVLALKIFCLKIL